MTNTSKKRKKIGYVILDFFKKDKEKIKNYSNEFIDKKDYFYIKLGGKSKGGLVLDKMHITLFYGLDNDKFDKKILNEIKVKNIELMELELFYIEEFKCNALILKVNDDNKELEKINDKLSKFDVLKDKINHFKFNPHITIAYVKKDFEIKDNDYFKNKKIDILDVKYKIKN